MVCRRIQADGELLKYSTVSAFELYDATMRLDGPTIVNLELLEGAEGTRQVDA